MLLEQIMARFEFHAFDVRHRVPGLRTVAACLADTLTLIQTWQRRHRSSRQLARVDARVLRDAGISEAQRFVAINKPFWRQ